ncbi:hypothetical protein Syun_005881 [Stephania yunnanensis]|uniref:Uncharacterized protein n=1 Tax=Stephania yunnanensis TaxID=152371 RepID=A0AAP0KY62_9MAGN
MCFNNVPSKTSKSTLTDEQLKPPFVLTLANEEIASNHEHRYWDRVRLLLKSLI